MLAVVVIIIIVLILVIVGSAKGNTAGSKTTGRTTPAGSASAGHRANASKTRTTKYEQSGNWMDFDIGRDEKKVGDPKYPKAGIDSVMKHEFMDELLNDK